MKDSILFFFITLVYLTFRATILPSVPLPDIPLIIVFLLSYYKPSLKDLPLCFVLGFTVDSLTGGFTGLTSLTLTAVYTINYLAAIRVPYDNALLRACGAGLASLTGGTISYLVIRSFNSEIHYFSHVLPVALITAALAPLIISLLLKAMSLGSHARQEGKIF